MTNYIDWAGRMPADESLLPAIGRVNWAAARLHAYVRDAINQIEGAPSDEPFELTLGQAVAQLELLADKWLREPDRTAVMAWCTQFGRPAVAKRNKVVHAVTFTAPDGMQAIRTSDNSPPERFRENDLVRVVGQLVEAQAELAPGPYVTKF